MLLATPAVARPGFYVELGLGRASVSGEAVPVDRLQPSAAGERIQEIPALTTDLGGNAMAAFAIGYNFFGYAALDAHVTGFGSSLDNATTRAWGAAAGLGLRVYPLWHWQGRLPPWLQPLEPALLFMPGTGLAYQSYVPDPRGDAMGWSQWGIWRYGLAVEYFLLDNLKLAATYAYVGHSYESFIFNIEDSRVFPVSPPAAFGVHEFFLSLAFQVGTGTKQHPYGQWR
jgi:hypothetical protein